MEEINKKVVEQDVELMKDIESRFKFVPVCIANGEFKIVEKMMLINVINDEIK